jgi:hypothetical protein
MKVYSKTHTNFDALRGHEKNISEKNGVSGWKYGKTDKEYIIYYSFDAPQVHKIKKLIATKPIRVFIEKNDMNLPIEKTNIGKIPADRRENISWKGCYYTIKPKEEFNYRDSNHYDLSHFTLNNGLNFKIETGNPIGWILSREITIK